MTTSLMAGASTTDDSAAVANAVEKMRVAMLASDGATLGKLVERNLSYGHSSGRIQDRGDFLKELDGTNSFKSLRLSRQTVQIDGNVAIVRHTFDSQNNLPGGKVGTAHIGVMQTWIKHPDGWRLLARQAYLLPRQ